MNKPDIQYVDVLPTDSPESVTDKIDTAILITNGAKSMRRDRPYSGQRHTCLGQRGQQEVSGVTMRDIYDCFVRGFILSHPSMSNDGKLLRSNDEIIREALKGRVAISMGLISINSPERWILLQLFKTQCVR